MGVLTISRQYGSGGSVIARRAAERLGWTVIDNEFVDRVAERAGLPPEEVAAREERTATLMERLATTLAVSSPELFLASADLSPETARSAADIARITEAVITEAADHGDVVLVGRGAQACLARRENTLHVRVIAPRDIRIRTVAQRFGIDEKAAEQTLDHRDDERKEYVRAHYQRDWNDPSNYHLIVNSALLSYDGATDLIVDAVETLGLRDRSP